MTCVLMRYLSCLLFLTLFPKAFAEELKQDSLLNHNKTQVVALGYHEFSAVKKGSAMRITTSLFAEQMQAIKDSGIRVISLTEFLQWRKGHLELPAQAVLITIDDGWISVYEEAFAVLKKHRFPFTIFLYQNYLNGGGRALTTTMVNEMLQHGCEIGCHSKSHPLPSSFRKKQKVSPESYQKYLQTEILFPKAFFEKTFQRPVTTYAYPGGYQPPETLSLLSKWGYEACFTVKPGVITRETPFEALPRHIVYGHLPQTFLRALDFPVTKNSSFSQNQNTQFPVLPKAGSSSSDRFAQIEIDLSSLTDLDPRSIRLEVSSYGNVPHSFDPIKQSVSWKPSIPYRSEEVIARLFWKKTGQKHSNLPMTWSFQIELENSYLQSLGQ